MNILPLKYGIMVRYLEILISEQEF